MGPGIIARFVVLLSAISFVVKLGETTTSPDHCVDEVIACFEDEECYQCATSPPDDDEVFATCHDAGQALGMGEDHCDTTFMIPCCRDRSIDLDCFSNTQWMAYAQCIYPRVLDADHCIFSSESCDLIWRSYDEATLPPLVDPNMTASPTASPTQSERDQAFTTHNSAVGALSPAGLVHDFPLVLAIAVVGREVAYAWWLE